MTTASIPAPAAPESLRLALLIQGAVLSVSALEAVVFGVAAGGVSIAAVMTVAAASWVFAVRRKLDRPRRLRWLIRLEYLLLATGAIDFLLAIFLAHRSLDVVAALTRILLPVLVVVLARRQLPQEVST